MLFFFLFFLNKVVCVSFDPRGEVILVGYNCISLSDSIVKLPMLFVVLSIIHPSWSEGTKFHPNYVSDFSPSPGFPYSSPGGRWASFSFSFLDLANHREVISEQLLLYSTGTDLEKLKNPHIHINI